MSKKKTIIAKRETKTAAKVAVAVPSVEMRNVRLYKCACALGAGPVPQLRQTITQQIMPTAKKPNVLIVNIDFDLSGQTADGKEGPHLAAGFGAIYTIESLERFTPEQVSEFLPTIALNNIWPYWREFVQSTTVRMGLPPLQLPSLQGVEVTSSMTTISKMVEHTETPQDITGKAKNRSK
jgi:hypothetical protein